MDVYGGHFWWRLGEVALAGNRSSSLTDRETPQQRLAEGLSAIGLTILQLGNAVTGGRIFAVNS